MKLRLLSAGALPAIAACAFATSFALTPAVSQAAIVSGSTAQFTGTAFFTPMGDIEFTSVGPAPAGSDAAIRINLSGNTGSFAGYDEPNPDLLPISPNYVSGFQNIIGSMAPAGNLIQLPAIVVAGEEVGPGVGASRFVADTWETTIQIVDGIAFLQGVAVGTIFDDSDGTFIGGEFSLSSQNFQPGVELTNSFSATLRAAGTPLNPDPDATVIPVPAAGWLLGSGLLMLLGVRRLR